MEKKIVYLCGPIDSRIVASETLEEKRERFAIAQAYCEAQGWEVFNPFEFGQKWLSEHHGSSISVIMSMEKMHLQNCTHILLMANWMYSAGCLEEVNYAGRLYIEEFAKAHDCKPKFIKFLYEDYDTIMAGREFLFNKQKADYSDNKDLIKFL